MDIRFLSLRAADAPAVVAFYRDILELPCLAHGESYGVLQAGSTQLMFEQAEHGQPFYHFAFDIPRNQLQPAGAARNRRRRSRGLAQLCRVSAGLCRGLFYCQSVRQKNFRRLILMENEGT